MDQITIPLGCKFKFDPEDHELLVYLSSKCKGELLPCEGFIQEVDLYRLTDPGLLFERTQEKVVYVFTKLKKMGKNGKRVDRSVLGNRTWKGVDGGKPIYDARGCPVGEKKNFVLVNKMKMKLGYNMTEFSLDDDALRKSRFNDYVVCQIKKKTKKLRSLKDGMFPEEDTCPTSVSTPAIEGDLMAYSEEGSLDEGNSFAPRQSQGEPYLEEGNSFAPRQSQGEQAGQFYQSSESHEGTTDFMTMLCEDFDSDINSRFFQSFPEEYQFQEVNPWMTDTTVNQFAQNQDQQEAEQGNQPSFLDTTTGFYWDDLYSTTN